MPSWTVVKTLLRELVTFERSERVPEPDLVMDDPEKVAAFERAGREDGVLAGIYLFHAAHISEVIKPGDLALDLGCGPANQLGLVARLNPETRFLGIDMSEPMLEKARRHIAELGLTNVEFRAGDMTNLDFLEDQSMDAVFSTVALHHLPTVEHLDRTFAEIARVLKPGGGLYLVDFGHLKSEKSIRDMAYMYADRQPELFTLDYLASLHAAFEKRELLRLMKKHLCNSANFHSTFVAPFLVAIKSDSRQIQTSALTNRFKAKLQSLEKRQSADIMELNRFFISGGLNCYLFQ